MPVVLILSLLLGLQPITTDLYLPALPSIRTGLGASVAAIQLTLTGLLLAFGLSQLVWGPLSDRVGRKPVLWIGLLAYSASAVGAAFAPSIDSLIAWRVLMGIAMGAGVVVARSLVRDLYEPADGARIMAAGLGGLGVIACLSGPLGGVLADWMGWRAAMASLAVFGCATLAVIALRFDETLLAPNPHALNPAVLARNWRAIASHPTFWAYAMLVSATYAGLFTFLASSSFVYIQVLGWSAAAYGWVLLLSSLVYIGGTFLCRKLLVSRGMRGAVKLGGFFSAGCAVLTLVLVHFGPKFGVPVWAAILLPWPLYMLGHGIHQPCSQAGAVGPFPQMAGAAAALNGCLMMFVAFGVGQWLGWRIDNTVLPLAHGTALWGLVVGAVAWTLVQKFGEPKPT
jgi:MFS transporter, DHA1 family, multidrug resistance protein